MQKKKPVNHSLVKIIKKKINLGNYLIETSVEFYVEKEPVNQFFTYCIVIIIEKKNFGNYLTYLISNNIFGVYGNFQFFPIKRGPLSIYIQRSRFKIL